MITYNVIERKFYNSEGGVSSGAMSIYHDCLSILNRGNHIPFTLFATHRSQSINGSMIDLLRHQQYVLSDDSTGRRLSGNTSENRISVAGDGYSYDAVDFLSPFVRFVNRVDDDLTINYGNGLSIVVMPGVCPSSDASRIVTSQLIDSNEEVEAEFIATVDNVGAIRLINDAIFEFRTAFMEHINSLHTQDSESLPSNRHTDELINMSATPRAIDDSRGPRLFRYHHGPRNSKIMGSDNFRIGFEVEKEDEVARNKYAARVVAKETMWSKERDGSLNESSGFELVSPIYGLYESVLDDDLKMDILREHINADISSSCGGHVHLSKRGTEGSELFESLSSWIPMIYSLYVGRIHRHYCRVKKNDDIINGEDKYQSIRIFDDRVEFRIISAVRDVDNLVWRRDLFRIICRNLDITPFSVVSMLSDKKSELYKHLAEVYSESSIRKKLKLYAFFADELLDVEHKVSMDGVRAADMFSSAQIQHLKNHQFNIGDDDGANVPTTEIRVSYDPNRFSAASAMRTSTTFAMSGTMPTILSSDTLPY